MIQTKEKDFLYPAKIGNFYSQIFSVKKKTRRLEKKPEIKKRVLSSNMELQLPVEAHENNMTLE